MDGSSGLIIFIYVLAMILELAILLWVQSDLNEYWRTTRGNNAESLSFSGGEMIVAVIGLLLTIGSFGSL